MTGEPEADEEPSGLPLQPVATYTDEHGRTVRVYPPRYAEGGGMQPFTAKPRRG